MKGLLVFTYRSQYDATNGGISAKHDQFVLVGEGIPEIFEPSAESPALVLVECTIYGKKYLHAEPVEFPLWGNVGWMTGGNFVWTSDSRFPNRYPISVHDRQETQSQYETLTV